MLTVTALARECGTTPHTVRYYSRLGLLRERRHPGNEYRLFDQAEQARLRFILQARELGYTLKEIRAILEDADSGSSPCPRVRRILQQRIAENRERIAALSRLQARMEEALETWNRMPDGVPDGHSVCHLIESFDATAEAGGEPSPDHTDKLRRESWMSSS